MNRENLIKLREYLEKCLEYKNRKLELDKINPLKLTSEDIKKRDFGLDLIEVWLVLRNVLDPDMYEINKNALSKEAIKRKFSK